MKARQKGKQAYALTKVYQLSKAIEGLGVRFVGLHPWCLENEKYKNLHKMMEEDDEDY